MRNTLPLLAISLSVGFAFACGDAAPGADATAKAGTQAPTVTPGVGNSGAATASDDIGPANVTGVGAGTGAPTGLPCDVQQLLENRCIGCHAGGGSSLAPLLSYDDLIAKSKSDPTKTIAQLCLERMKSTTRPMPPAPAVAPDAAEIATFEAWVTSGTAKGAACTSSVGGGAASDGGPGPYATPSVCTSNKRWASGNEGSGNMRPGGACQTCHQQRGGPSFDVAGTVYATAHEPNDCNGKGPPPALTLVVTDKNGKVTNLPVNAVGNFYSRAQIVPPFRVQVTDGTKTRAMAGSLTAGDCNSCHTEKGANGAPGRIMAP